MAAAFPFVDPFARVDFALGRVFHCRREMLAALLASVEGVWSLHPNVHRWSLATRTRQLRVVVMRILRVVIVHPPPRSLSLDQLHTLLSLLRSLVSGSISLQRFAKQLHADTIISGVQVRFSEFTSGWKLCNEIGELLKCSFTGSQEFAIDVKWFGVQHQFRECPSADDNSNSNSIATSRSVASSKFSVATTARFELKKEHYRSPLSESIREEGSENTEKFGLRTLEEHRFATRFHEKKVTAKTWRAALREAHQLIRSGDRVKLADALYILLEVIWLDPRGYNLATLYLDTGSIYLEFDHLKEATKMFRNSLRLDPTNWKARYNMGVTAARLQDFVEATKQMKLALESCPADVAEEITAMLEEIDRIQCSRNFRAFRETRKAREFTTQYLESLSHVSPTRGKTRVLDSSALPEDHTLSHRNGTTLISASPQVLDFSSEWRGALASLLHRLHVFASCRRLCVQDEMRRLNPTRTGRISLKTFNEAVVRITGTPLRISECKELARVFGDDGTMLFHFLALNPETTTALEELQGHGASHAILEWTLFQNRAKRSANSRAGGFWYWLDITMTKWIEQVLPSLSQTHPTAKTIMETLNMLGWFTPFDFVWTWKVLPEPDDLQMLKLADRGVFIYECHRTRCSIRNEASRTLQMCVRRFLVHKQQLKKALKVNCHNERRANEQFFSEDDQARLDADTSIDKQIMQSVLLCVDDIIDDLVANLRQEQKSYEDAVRWQEIPVRTELRQKIISAVGVVQNAARESTPV